MRYIVIILAIGSYLFMTKQAQAQDFRWINEYQYLSVNTAFDNPQNFISNPKHRAQSILLFEDQLKVKEKARIITQLRGSATGSLVDSQSTINADARLGVNELYLTYSDEKFTLSVGRKRVRWGVGYVASPTDIISRPPDPEDSNDYLFALTGTDLLQLTFPKEKSQFELIYMPPSKTSEVYEKVNAFASRYYRYVKPFDISIMGKVDDNLEYQIGTNVSVALGNSLELHGEYLFDSFNGQLVPDNQVPERFTSSNSKTMRFLIGGQWSPSKKLNWATEFLYFHNGYSNAEWNTYKTIVDDLHLQYNILSLRPMVEQILSSRINNPSPLRKKYLFNRFYYRNLPRTFDMELVMFTNLSDYNTFYRLANNWRFRESGSLSLFSHIIFSTGNARGEFKLTAPLNVFRLGIQWLW